MRIFYLTVCLLFTISVVQTYSQTNNLNDFSFCAYHKIKKETLTREETTKFLEKYHSKEYLKVKSDEFMCRTYVDKMHRIFSNTIDTLNIHNQFSFTTTLGIGEYDLEKKGYPLKINNYIITNSIDKYGYVCSPENRNDYSFLPIPLDKALILLKQIETNHRYDNISLSARSQDLFDRRPIEGVIKIKLSENVNYKEYTKYSTTHQEYYISCAITDVYLLDKGIDKMYIKPIIEE